MKRFAVLSLMMVLFASIAWAGPIAPKDIGADAKWFGHVDFDAIRSLALVQDLKDKCPDKARCEEKMQSLARKIGLDSLDDVQGVTLYSTQYGGKMGVALFYAKKLDKQKMLDLLKEKHPDRTTAEYGSRTLYGWTAGHEGHKMDLTGAFASETLLVIGAGAAQVQAALDVLDGKKAGLASSAPLLAGIPEKALFASRAIDVPEDYRKTTRCPVLRNCKSATVAWAEANGQITGKYDFAADSPETANNFKAIVEGFKAMGLLRFGDLPAVKKVLDGATTAVDGATFTATFAATTADIEAAIQAVMERRKAATSPAAAPAAK